jgi:hypothetical protein
MYVHKYRSIYGWISYKVHFSLLCCAGRVQRYCTSVTVVQIKLPILSAAGTAALNLLHWGLGRLISTEIIRSIAPYGGGPTAWNPS